MDGDSELRQYPSETNDERMGIAMGIFAVICSAYNGLLQYRPVTACVTKSSLARPEEKLIPLKFVQAK
jgi:hypothetical protein